MPNISFELSISSIDRAIRELDAYQKKVEYVEDNIVDIVTEKAHKLISDNLNRVINADGNVLAYSGKYVFGKTGFAFLQGEQASFLEFGTGVVGQNSSHVMAEEVGWKYASGSKIFRRKSDNALGWIYQDKTTGKFKWTEGIPAQNIVYNAAQKIKGEILETAKEMMK